MKYIRTFLESVNFSIPDIVSDCRDILLDFSDNGYYSNAFMKLDGTTIVVEIGDEVKMIKLHEFGDVLLRLMDYMKSKGWELSNKSFIRNDTWDPETVCPECGDYSVKRSNDDEGETLMYCQSCGCEGLLHKFQDFRHFIKKRDIDFFIKNKYWVQYMNLKFVKSPTQ